MRALGTVLVPDTQPRAWHFLASSRLAERPAVRRPVAAASLFDAVYGCLIGAAAGDPEQPAGDRRANFHVLSRQMVGALEAERERIRGRLSSLDQLLQAPGAVESEAGGDRAA